MQKKILIRFDDVCPTMNWKEWMDALDILNEYDCKALIGVIPDNRDDDLMIEDSRDYFWDHIRYLKRQGFTLAMHGYQHLLTSHGIALVTKRRDSEFAGLSYDKQFEKIKHGKEILVSNGIYTDIFIAPAHSYDANTLKVLNKLGFRYISDGKTLKPITREGVLCLPCMTGGFPYLFLGKCHTVVLHAHEWKNNNLKNRFIKFVKQNKDNIVSFEEFRNSEKGNYLIQILIEKIAIFLIYNIRPLVRKLNRFLILKH